MSLSPLGAFGLALAARTAAHAALAVAERRAGREPSADEPDADARADLRAVADAAGVLALRLRTREAMSTPDDPDAASVRAFADRLLADDVARLASRGHRKLLSLYPAVPESLPEGARCLARDARAAASLDAVPLGSLAARLAAWRDELDDALDAGRA